MTTYDSRTLWRHAWRAERTATRNGTTPDAVSTVVGRPTLAAVERLADRTTADPWYQSATARTRRALLITAARQEVHGGAIYAALMRAAVRTAYRCAASCDRPRIDAPDTRGNVGRH